MEVHEQPARPDRAAVAYREFYASAPDDAHAQLGMVRAVLRALYEASGAEALERAWGEAESLAEALPAGATRSALHLQVAQAADRLRRPAADAWRHYRAADALGVAQASARGAMWLRLSELAAARNEVAAAREYAARFLAAFPRDPRVADLEAWVAALPGGGSRP
jgi:hypothetical protein